MGRIDYETETMIAHTLLGKENDSHAADLDTYVSFAIQAGATRENPDSGPDGVGIQSGHAYTIEARPEAQAVAFTCSEMANSFAWERDVYPTLDAQIPNDSSNIQKGIRQGWAVRRLTPRECERLQGFPDGYSNIPWRGQPEAPDGPRYKALGNSMAVNVMRWIGTRIQMVQDICDEGI